MEGVAEAALAPAPTPAPTADEKAAAAFAEYRAGRLDEAVVLYREALDIDPLHVDSLHMLGLVLHRQGKNPEAARLMAASIARKPDVAHHHNNLGIVLAALRRFDEAAAAYRESIRLRPDYVEAHYNMGIALRDGGHKEEAIACYREAVRLRPDYADAWYNLANTLGELDRPKEAEPAYREVIRINPDYASAHNNLGILLKAQGRRDDAESCYREILRIKPDNADAWYNLGNLLREKQKLEEAMECLAAATRHRPDFADAYNNLGIVQRELSHFAEAEASWLEALRIRPDYLEAHSNLGIVLKDLRRLDDAVAKCREAIGIRPEFPDAHLNLSLTLLLAGRYLEAWEEYEWRWQVKAQFTPRGFKEPLWQGEEIGNRTVLIYAEQGLGDSLQFIRYLPLLIERAKPGGGRVVFEAPRPLLRLFSGIEGVAQIVAKGDPLPAFDLQCPLLSLPRAFGTTVETIPASIPYLKADPAAAAFWRRRLQELPGLRVGLVWAGGGVYLGNRRRSMSLAAFGKLGAVPGVSLVSLQKGDGAKESNTPPPGLKFMDWTEELQDFADTAALVDGLDLVISVDTSVAHLAGALGKQVWLLNRYDTCWRWLLDREDSPWYPNIRVFRQPRPGDWNAVIEEVAGKLSLLRPPADRDEAPAALPMPVLPVSSVPEWLSAALTHYRSGRLREAAGLYRLILEADPLHADAMQISGLIAHRQGRNDEAARLMGESIAQAPLVAHYHNNLGIVLAALRRFAEAAVFYREAIRLRPDYVEAYFNLGIALRDSNRRDEACAAYREAVRLRPDYADAHYNLANLLKDLGRPDEAEASYRALIRHKPDYVAGHNNLGIMLRGQGRLAEAEACYREVLRLKPDYAEVHYNLANLLKDAQRREEAVIAYREAIRCRPDYAEAYNNLGLVTKDLYGPEEAASCWRDALRIKPDYVEAHNNLGIALKDQARFAEAEQCWREALRHRPGYAEAYNNLGIVLKDMRRLDEAEQCCREAIRLRPDFPDAHFNLSLALLTKGDYAQGWDEFEWRWQVKAQMVPRGFSQPWWKGEPLEGRVLMLYAEQGLGDTLQFCRYVPLAAARAKMLGGRVFLEVPKPLARLVSGFEGVEIVVKGEPLPAFDLQCPLMSLPHIFGTSLETIPSKPPYLTADPEAVAGWRERLSELPGRRVGLVWAGGTIYLGNSRRSMTLAALQKLGAVGGVSFVSLQKGEGAKEAATPPPGFPFTDWTDELEDFADTAALVEALDLVISVDTSVAHLAGALGKKVWLLNRYDTCWRWLHDREDSPWYPSLRIFRQPEPGDWDSVVARVALELGALPAEKRAKEKPGKKKPPVKALAKPALPPAPDPRLAEALAHFRDSRFDEAEAVYRAIVETAPANADAGQPANANADAVHMLGLIQHRRGRNAEAAPLMARSIELSPRVPHYHSNLGIVLAALGRLDEAAACYREAVKLKPDYVEVHYNLGIALKEANHVEDAVASYREALRLRPEYVEASYNLGNTFRDVYRLEEAVESYREAIRHRPDYADAYNNLGLALRDLGRYPEAETAWREVIRLKPGHLEAYTNLGIALKDMRRLDEAEDFCREAIRLNPDFPDAHLNLSLTLLIAGRYLEAWEEYEWRWQVKAQFTPRGFKEPLWQGEALGTRTLLIYAEQGLGDSLQFIRYVPLLIERTKTEGGRIVLELPRALIRLFSGIEGVAQIVAKGDPLPGFDMQSPLLSLPRAFGTTLGTIPCPVPYLKADPVAVASWRRRVEELPGLRVGLVWAGGGVYLGNRRRSMALSAFAKLGTVQGVSFVSLQKGDGAAQSNAPPPGLTLTDWTGELQDFADTAALVEALDLVISVDTSVAHVAGALGKKLWLLNRYDTCWRWLLDREDSPWYKNIHIFRQPTPGDWNAVIDEVAAALGALAAINAGG